ncbi:unnamed protein product [marine sediment metagenome]|uniref:Uncharacterized protein n=1 Tax=marine sediment metagenome TaxID=412755 RepID=X0YXV2_9ZZZZ
MAKKGLRIGATVGLLAGSFLLIKDAMAFKDPNAKMDHIVRNLTGWSITKGNWDWQRMKFTIPVVAGIGLSIVASKTGMNRYTPKGINL